MGFALGAGLVAALNPCGFAMLPAYMMLVVRGDAAGQLTALGRAVGATIEMVLGFMIVFGRSDCLRYPQPRRCSDTCRMSPC